MFCIIIREHLLKYALLKKTLASENELSPPLLKKQITEVCILWNPDIFLFWLSV